MTKTSFLQQVKIVVSEVGHCGQPLHCCRPALQSHYLMLIHFLRNSPDPLVYYRSLKSLAVLGLVYGLPPTGIFISTI